MSPVVINVPVHKAGTPHTHTHLFQVQLRGELGEVPELGTLVVGDGDQDRAVPREGQIGDHGGVAGKVPDQVTVSNVPNQDPVVEATWRKGKALK